MSIKMMAVVWDDSPYSATQRLIHLALADFADDEGYLYPKQETIAKKAACSRETVNRTLHKMVEDGYLEVIERTPRFARYRLTKPSDVTNRHTGDVTDDHTGDVTNRHSDVTNDHMHRTVNEPSGKNRQKKSRASGTRNGQERDMLGELPPDEPEKEEQKSRTVPDRNTQAWCVRRFANEATKHGHPRYNQGIVRREIKRLRDAGYSYEEIDVLIAGWFWKSELFIRNSANNIATLFVHGMPETEKRMADRIRTMRSGVDPDAYFEEQQAMLREALGGNA